MSDPLPERLARAAMESGVQMKGLETSIAAAIRGALDEAAKAVCGLCRTGVRRTTDHHGTYHGWGQMKDGAWTSRTPCQAAAIAALKT
mgnify:CR=1 FL=1